MIVRTSVACRTTVCSPRNRYVTSKAQNEALRLGKLFYEGDGVIVDKREAARLFLVASQQGSAEAKFLLAQMYCAGEGVTKDLDKAKRLFNEAADLGLDVSRFVAQILPAEGDKDYVLSVDEIEDECRAFADAQQFDAASRRKIHELLLDLRAAKPDAQFMMGVMYLRGNGVDTNQEKAIYLLRQASDQGHTEAQYTLALALGLRGGKDSEEAITYFQKAATNSHKGAKYWLGAAHYHGMGVPVDKEKAAVLFQLAAEEGNEDALCKLATMHMKGEVVDFNLQEAIRLWKLAAEKGHAESQYQLALLYLGGEGVAADHTEGEKLLRLSAEQDFAAAQFSLGEMYWRGLGVRVNKSLANEFYDAAEKNGYRGRRRRTCTIL